MLNDGAIRFGSEIKLRAHDKSKNSESFEVLRIACVRLTIEIVKSRCVNVAWEFCKRIEKT